MVVRTKTHPAGAQALGPELHVGDEVISACGSMSGFILSINGSEAVVTWSCRGKSVEPLHGLVQTEHRPM